MKVASDMAVSRRFTYDVSARLRQFRSLAGLVAILSLFYIYTGPKNTAIGKNLLSFLALLIALILSLPSFVSRALKYSAIEIDETRITARAFGAPWRSFKWTSVANIQGVQTQEAGKAIRINKVCILHKNYSDRIEFTRDLKDFYDLIEVLNRKSQECHFDVFDLNATFAGAGRLDEKYLVGKLQDRS